MNGVMRAYVAAVLLLVAAGCGGGAPKPIMPDANGNCPSLMEGLYTMHIAVGADTCGGAGGETTQTIYLAAGQDGLGGSSACMITNRKQVPNACAVDATMVCNDGTRVAGRMAITGVGRARFTGTFSLNGCYASATIDYQAQ
jgi:hypothetical protein